MTRAPAMIRVMCASSLVTGLLACGGPELEGAVAVPRMREPVARTSVTWSANACRDGSGSPATTAAEFRVIRDHDGRELLVERRRGYDSIVVHRRFEREGANVFEFSAESSEGPELLHSVRLPRGAGAGQLTIVDRSATPQTGARAVVLACRLDREKPVE